MSSMRQRTTAASERVISEIRAKLAEKVRIIDPVQQEIIEEREEEARLAREKAEANTKVNVQKSLPLKVNRGGIYSW